MGRRKGEKRCERDKQPPRTAPSTSRLQPAIGVGFFGFTRVFTLLSTGVSLSLEIYLGSRRRGRWERTQEAEGGSGEDTDTAGGY